MFIRDAWLRIHPLIRTGFVFCGVIVATLLALVGLILAIGLLQKFPAETVFIFVVLVFSGAISHEYYQRTTKK